MSNSQWFCIRLDLLGLFIINKVLLSVLGLGGDAKGIEVISCMQTFSLTTLFFFFKDMFPFCHSRIHKNTCIVVLLFAEACWNKGQN